MRHTAFAQMQHRCEQLIVNDQGIHGNLLYWADAAWSLEPATHRVLSLSAARKIRFKLTFMAKSVSIV